MNRRFSLAVIASLALIVFSCKPSRNGGDTATVIGDEDEFIPGLKDEMFETFAGDDELAAEGYSIEDIPESEDDDNDFGFGADDYSEEDE